MNNIEYEKIVKKHTPKINHVKSMSLAFFVGGFIGLLGQVLIDLYIKIFNVSIKDASSYMIITLIFISSLFTALGFFDKIIEKVKCGIIIPITGFAHGMTSAAIEYKKDGLILGLGSNIFKITGSVILYGVVSAYIFALIRIFIVGV